MLREFLTSFMSQQWEDLLFLHWPVSPDCLAFKLPPGLEPDLFDDEAWLSVVGFRLTQLRIKPFTQIPWRDFNEVNLRTYVKDSAGNKGVWFFSLDSSDLLAVLGARLMYGLNYRFSSIRSGFKSNTMGYRAETRFPSSGVQSELSTQCPHLRDEGEVPKKGTIDFFLLERYRFWSAKVYKGNLSTGQVSHPPYNPVRLSQAEYKGDLFRCQGLDEPVTKPALIHYCKGFPVTASAPSWAFGIAGQANHK